MRILGPRRACLLDEVSLALELLASRQSSDVISNQGVSFIVVHQRLLVQLPAPDPRVRHVWVSIKLHDKRRLLSWDLDGHRSVRSGKVSL